MERATDVEQLAAEIRNAAWWVRHYRRGRRGTGAMRLQRQQAIQKLGLTVRRAFSASDDFEVLLIALVEALTPRDYEPPF